jgi:transposase
MGSARSDVALLDDPDLLAAAYGSSRSMADLAAEVGVSYSTVRRALVRHGIARLPRNRNRRPASARVLDDRRWLRERYRTDSAVGIATELGVSARTVYAAMDRHGITRRTEPGTLKLRRPELADEDWLHSAVERSSSATVAAELEVSSGTVTAAYALAGIDPASTPHLYERGHSRQRPSADELRAAWDAKGTFSSVGRRLGIAHTTAAVWLGEL